MLKQVVHIVTTLLYWVNTSRITTVAGVKLQPQYNMNIFFAMYVLDSAVRLSVDDMYFIYKIVYCYFIMF
jgi:hypothetical protein